MFEKNLHIGFLLDFYGDVLSERKRTVLDYYYNQDLSLAEIAGEIGISRQGCLLYTSSCAIGPSVDFMIKEEAI